MKKAPNFNFLDHYTYFVPNVPDLLILFLWFVVGTVLGNVISFIFLKVLGPEAGMEVGLVVAYPAMFIPPMIYASSRSRRNCLSRRGLKMDSSNFGVLGPGLCVLFVIVGTLCASYIADAVGAILPRMPERLKEAARCSKFLRENFPDVKIMIGNSIASSKFVAELLAGGFPETGADFAGLEAVGEASLPEMLSSRSSQAAEFMRETLKCFDCKWGLTQCFESNFRTDTLLGEERQAEWYVRDVLLAHLWKFDDIYVGGAINAGNHYTATVWGDSDICRRMPYCYPKKAYVALATATKVLDGVTDREVLDTGDRTVYAVRYTCRRGRQAYALWTRRGTAEVRLGLRGVCSACDMYGRTISAEERMTVGERPLYLLGGTRPFVTSARVASRSFPETVVPPDFRVVVPADDDEAWEVVPGELAGVQCAN